MISDHLRFKIRNLIKAAEQVIECECKSKDELDRPYLDLAIYIQSLTEEELKELE